MQTCQSSPALGRSAASCCSTDLQPNVHTTHNHSQLGVSTNVNWQQPSQAATNTGSSTVPNVHTRRHTHTRLMALFRDCTKCNSLHISVPTVILPYTIYVPINGLTNIRRLQLCVHCASAGWRHRATLAYEQIWRHLEVHNVSPDRGGPSHSHR